MKLKKKMKGKFSIMDTVKGNKMKNLPLTTTWAELSKLPVHFSPIRRMENHRKQGFR